MNNNFLKILGLILLAVLSRFLPHPPNFSPIAAISLLAGAYFLNRGLALALPIIILFLSDLVLGFYPGMLFNYVGMMLVVLVGHNLKGRDSLIRVGGFSILGSTLFFIVSNFGVWFSQTIYPMNFSGLVSCYVNAIPFYGYTLAGDLAYGLALFSLAHVIGARPSVVAAEPYET